jgi:hypothetical protein
VNAKRQQKKQRRSVLKKRNLEEAGLIAAKLFRSRKKEGALKVDTKIIPFFCPGLYEYLLNMKIFIHHEEP